MKSYWQDSDELWFNGGQYIVEGPEGEDMVIVPVYANPDDDDYDKVKDEARQLAGKIAELLTK